MDSGEADVIIMKITSILIWALSMLYEVLVNENIPILHTLSNPNLSTNRAKKPWNIKISIYYNNK